MGTPQVIFIAPTETFGGFPLVIGNKNGTIRILASGPWNAFSPVLSPDKSRVLHVRCGGRNDCDLYTVRLDGTDAQRLTFSERTGSGQFSADGTRVIFTERLTAEDSTPILKSVPLAGGEPTTLWSFDNDVDRGKGVFGPLLSPDGSKIVFQQSASSGSLYTMNTDGTNRMQPISSQDIVFYDWLPDGRLLVSLSEGSRYPIETLRPDGSERVRLSLDDSFYRRGQHLTAGGTLLLYTQDHSVDRQATGIYGLTLATGRSAVVFPGNYLYGNSLPEIIW